MKNKVSNPFIDWCWYVDDLFRDWICLLYYVSNVIAWGVCDESLINVFNIIFESVLFIFDSVLYNILSFLELFYFNCKLFNYRNKHSKDWVLEQKKEDLELIRAENTKIEDKNMFPPSKKLGTAHATSHTIVPTPKIFFCCCCFPDNLPISLFLT